MVRWNGRLLVGFENHAGATYLGPTAQPLGQVISGYGNSGEGHEGTALGSAVGTHLRGPCLPRNPALADFLIRAALRRRQPGAELDPLPDDLERAARQAALHRARRAARGRGGRLIDTVRAKAGPAAGRGTALAGRRAGGAPVTAPPSAPPPAAGTRQAVPGTAAPAGRAGHDPGRPDGGDRSLLRHSGVMAAGTLASRITGFIRTAVLLYALGTKDLGDAYNVANTVPNAVYNLALGGILTSVAVPLIVSAAKKHADRGEAYDQRIFTLGVLVLGGITLLATAAAVPITAVYGHDMPNAATYHLTVLFSFFFLPQIFFYGVSSLAGAILNARGSFAAPMWTPIVNNVVVVAAAVGFMLVAGLNRSPGNISAGEIQLLGIGTTLGIVAQTVALVPSLRKVGFRWRPRFDFRRAEVSELGRMSGWMLGYIVTTQISFLVTTVVSNDAGARVCASCAGAGFAAFSNAWQLFQLPYAIVGMSVITAMLPRMSAHAAEGNNELVTSDYSTATRLASVIIVPSALILAVLGPALAQGVFGHGSTSASSARYLGLVFAVFSLGLLPYTIFNLQMRVFYAMHDNRTPALIGGVAMAVRIACQPGRAGPAAAAVRRGQPRDRLRAVEPGDGHGARPRAGQAGRRAGQQADPLQHAADARGRRARRAGGARGGARHQRRHVLGDGCVAGYRGHRRRRRPGRLPGGRPAAEDRRAPRPDRPAPLPAAGPGQLGGTAGNGAPPPVIM